VSNQLTDQIESTDLTSDSGGGAAILLENVTKRYGNNKPAVDQLTLEIPAGKVVMFVGKSGCGKTTTLKLINRLIEPTEGRIIIGGEDVSDMNGDKLRRNIGYVIQSGGLLPHLTVGANIAIVPKMLKWDKARIAERVDELLTMVSLDPATYRDRYPKELSGGQQQRIGVARALAADEVMLATCDAELLVWRRGDAVYNPSRGFFLAGGAAGLALTAAFFGGRAYLDSRRRRAAEADSVERWRHLADARLTVSTDGIYLGTGEGVMPIAFRDVQEARLTGTGEIVMAASNANGSARWKLRAQWSELVLVLWAGRYMPEHPQIVGRTWLPGDWLIHAAAHGYDVDTSAWPRLTPRALR